MPIAFCDYCKKPFTKNRPWQNFCCSSHREHHHLEERRKRANALVLLQIAQKELADTQAELGLTKELLRETKDDLAAALAQLRTAGLLPEVESSNFLKLRMDPSEYTIDPPKPGRTPPQPIKREGLFR